MLDMGPVLCYSVFLDTKDNLMNERIRELIKQAKQITAEQHTPGSSKYEQEIYVCFAKLIVRNCIEVIQNESMNSDDEWEDGLVIAQKAIEEHFGVEE